MRKAWLISGMVICLCIVGCSTVQRFTIVPQAEAAVQAHRVFLTNFHRETVLTVKKYQESTLEPDKQFLGWPAEKLPSDLQDAQKHLLEARKLCEKIANNDKPYGAGDMPVLGVELEREWQKEVKAATAHVDAAEAAIKKFKGE